MLEKVRVDFVDCDFLDGAAVNGWETNKLLHEKVPAILLVDRNFLHLAIWSREKSLSVFVIDDSANQKVKVGRDDRA